MVQKPKAITYKVVLGYLLLFAMAALAVWVVYSEILKIASPAQGRDDNQKIIRISNAITDLYASEAISRTSILTGAPEDQQHYNNLIDSISHDIDSLKKDVESAQVSKFDSIQILLQRKKKSVNEVIDYQRKYGRQNTFIAAKKGANNTRDSIWKNTKPVETTTRLEWQKTVNSLLSPRLKDSLSKLQVSNDTLVMAINSVISKLQVKDERLKTTLDRKEQKLLEESGIISDQLRAILSSVENEFLQKSYKQISESQAAIDSTIKMVAWIGAITLFFLIIFAWVIIRDLTNNQKYRRQLELLNRENEELLRTKTMLMATVTHDLQTPLGSIIGFHDLIKSSGISPKQNQYLGNIRESADYILKLVNDLLDFSRLENNRISIEKKSFNLKASIENTCKTLEPMAVNKGIELNWDIDEELNANYISDPYRIKQALTNLVSNAIKFTQEGSVEVTGRIEDGKIHISVLDTGIGIAKNKHEDVFREFTQAHSGIEKKFGGTGLGLTISKKILELLDGEIVLESEEGQGSIFTIIIPCVPCAEEPEERKTDKGRQYPSLENKQILVIDDDNMQLTLMKELLANYPVKVHTENNAKSVIEILKAKNFDLILTDIQMPSIDGFELVNLIRSHENNRINCIPVIALSGKRDLTVSDFTNAGFTASHPKPVVLEELLQLISDILDGNPVKETSRIEKQEIPENEDVLFNLRSLSQFTNNDPESLKAIVMTFVQSALDNCKELQKGALTNDEQLISETAHRMIPMLKQMEVYSIASLLAPLEDRTTGLDADDLRDYINDICERMDALSRELREEIA